MKSRSTGSSAARTASTEPSKYTLALVQESDVVCGFEGGFHIMRDDHGSHLQPFLQATNEMVDRIRGNRIEAGSGFIV